jgi:hypothetical protein
VVGCPNVRLPIGARVAVQRRERADRRTAWRLCGNRSGVGDDQGDIFQFCSFCFCAAVSCFPLAPIMFHFIFTFTFSSPFTFTFSFLIVFFFIPFCLSFSLSISFSFPLFMVSFRFY